MYKNYLSSLSEIITCFCLANFEDEDYVPDSILDKRKDDLYFMRNTDYHARFLLFDDKLNSYDNDDRTFCTEYGGKERFKKNLRESWNMREVSTVRIQ